MSGVAVGGIGVVSPAGWGVKALRQAIRNQEPCPVQSLKLRMSIQTSHEA